MRRAVKKDSSVHKFLEPYLAAGDQAAIDIARKAYWKKYSAEWRRNKRMATKHYMIDLSPADAKLAVAAARKHRVSTTRFIKQACFAYMDKKYVVPDVYAINEVLQMLAMNYNMLRALIDENIVHYQTGQTVLQQMGALEEKVAAQLRNPKTVEELVVEAIQGNPKYVETLELIIKNLKL